MRDFSGISDPYRVRVGDTLTSIARRCGTTVSQLQRLNRIKDPNRISAGQTIYLSEASARGVSVLFLDALRHPIEKLPYRLVVDGMTHAGTTDATGRGPRTPTPNADSTVEVWVLNAEGLWQQLARTVSGVGHKLLTLVSGAVVIPGKTQPLPAGSSPDGPPRQSDPRTSPGRQSLSPPVAGGTPVKNNPLIKSASKRGDQGQAVIQLSVDLPTDLLNLFQTFEGTGIHEEDWIAASERLSCESAVLKALAEVETGGRLAFWRLNSGRGAHLPAILYERHYFSRITAGRHDSLHPDVAWPSGYRPKDKLGRADPKMHDGNVDSDDVYSSFASSYLRLIKAYRLDADAALRSCSWGKFQIMGDNFALCGCESARDFVSTMARSEGAQLYLLTEFIRLKPRAWKNAKNKSLGREISLWDAIKTKDWPAIAFNYNGPNFRINKYDSKLQQAYDRHRAPSR